QSGGRACHRAAARRGAPARALASTAQRHRCRSRGVARGGRRMTATARTDLRRGACPGLSTPMQTGDGLLARLTPTGTVALDAMAGLAAAARRCGNGIIEITSRGSIQVRGLTHESAPAFADAVAALGIPAQDGVPVIADPLAGLDPREVVDA